jgi:hypothetical protein
MSSMPVTPATALSPAVQTRFNKDVKSQFMKEDSDTNTLGYITPEDLVDAAGATYLDCVNDASSDNTSFYLAYKAAVALATTAQNNGIRSPGSSDPEIMSSESDLLVDVLEAATAGGDLSLALANNDGVQEAAQAKVDDFSSKIDACLTEAINAVIKALPSLGTGSSDPAVLQDAISDALEAFVNAFSAELAKP